MSIDASYIAVVLSCALVNVLILAAWGLVLLLQRGWVGWLTASASHLLRNVLPAFTRDSPLARR
jgi:hypothetical protein